MRLVIIVISAVLLSVSCEKSVCQTDHLITPKEVDIEVTRLEKELFQQENRQGVTELLSQNRAFTDIFLHGDQYPSDTILGDKVFGLIQDPYIDTLYQEASDAFEDFDAIEQDLEGAFGRLQTLYPELKTPEVMTVVTGMYNDLFISDSLVIIGLDYFIGDGASYPPLNIPGYILSRYDYAHLAAIIAKFMAGSMIEAGDSETLLSEMVDFGKTYYLTSRLLPCTPDSILIGYTPKDMQLIQKNEAIIWANFVENKALYETSHIMKQKFLGERPNVYEISQECPGRIGAWVGWQIVKAYMDNNDVTLEELLANTNNDKIFSESGYKPKG